MSLHGALTIAGFANLPSGVTFLHSTADRFPGAGNRKQLTLTVFVTTTHPELLAGLIPLVDEIVT